MCRWFVLGLLIAAPCFAASAFQPSLSGKKLISYGTDWPNTAYVRSHIRDMEKHPFDGIVIGVSESTEPSLSGDMLGFHVWSKTAFDAAKYEHAIDDLRATKFEKFTDNFIQVEAMPGDVDWFDDAQWDAVVHNFRILARVAKLGGCVGLELDPEQYGAERVFTPLAWSDAKLHGKTEQQYKAQAIVRGEQLMRGLNAEFPGIKILCLFGPALTQACALSPKHDYALLAPFLEGMARAADEKTQIIDGFEQSYGYHVEPAFAAARESMQQARDTFTDKNAFDRVMRKGFGLWADNDSGHRGWSLDHPEKNCFQPATWQNGVHFALAYTDEYVWVWREKIHEWEYKEVSPAFEDAQRAARTGTVHVDVKRDLSGIDGSKRLASEEDRSWGASLGPLLQSNRVLVDLTTPGWMFRPDPDNKGVTEKWCDAKAVAPDWSPIEIARFWQEQGWDYDGYGWYRRTIALDEKPAGKVRIAFAGCDESADVYLNGERVGGHDVGESGWDQPFSVDLTGKLRAGANELAVRVLNRTGPGGIWKPAAIFTEHPFTTTGKKLIEYGWDCPDTAYVRAHVQEMEQRPFDGIVIRPTVAATQPGQREPSLGRDVFQRHRYDPAEIQHCIDDLAATKFEKFTDNFIQVLSQPGDVDFFDPDWDAITDNVKSMARIARAGHCVGLMLDPEQYSSHKIWTYADFSPEQRKTHTLDEYRAKARQRGEEFILAVNSEVPNAQILCLFGPSLTFGMQRSGENGYSLLAPFLEGMCIAGDRGTRIIDGCEQSYMYRTKTSFGAGREDVQLARQSFADGSAYDRAMRIGFGLWMDNDSKKRPWNTHDFANNYFQPDTWQDAIHYGLCASDEYVWVYCERFNWWDGKNLPPEYVAAQVAGPRCGGGHACCAPFVGAGEIYAARSDNASGATGNSAARSHAGAVGIPDRSERRGCRAALV